MDARLDALLSNRSSLVSRLGAGVPGRQALRSLARRLDAVHADAPSRDASLLHWEALVRWILRKDAPTRLAVFTWVLSETPEVAQAAGRHLRFLFEGGQSARLFASTGLPARSGLIAETGKRLMGRVLPDPPFDGDLAQLLARLFPSPRFTLALSTLESADVAEASRLLGHPLESLRSGLCDALLVLSARVAALGLADDLLERCEHETPGVSPFLALSRACDAFVHASGETCDDALGRLLETANDCRIVVSQVRVRLETGAVSLDLVYRLEMINAALMRIERVAKLSNACRRSEGGNTAQAKVAVALFGSLVTGATNERSVRALARKYTDLLSKKVVEHSGETGGHYITSTRRDFFRMFASAGGGGVLTALTTVLKYWIAGAKLPLLFSGLASTLNYAGSFILMQFAGFTLATKQPSATAATLARAVAQKDDTGDFSAWADVVARITRSQLAAALGNIGLVIPASVGVALLFAALDQPPLLDAQTSQAVVDSLHPFKSWTLPFAALTGVLLWLSSVGAGMVQNWANYRRLPEAVGHARSVRRLLGARGAQWVEGFLGRNMAGFGGNVSLGVLLAVTPMLGTLVGVALDVRHVTLSTGALTFAVATLGTGALATSGFIWAAVGIGLVASLNFGVSFACALWVAGRSEGMTRKGRRGLVRALVGKFRTAPLDFIRPPPDEPASAPALEPDG